MQEACLQDLLAFQNRTARAIDNQTLGLGSMSIDPLKPIDRLKSTAIFRKRACSSPDAEKWSDLIFWHSYRCWHQAACCCSAQLAAPAASSP